MNVDLRLGMCAVGSVIFFLQEGPLVKAPSKNERCAALRGL